MVKSSVAFDSESLLPRYVLTLSYASDLAVYLAARPTIAIWPGKSRGSIMPIDRTGVERAQWSQLDLNVNSDASSNPPRFLCTTLSKKLDAGQPRSPS